MESPCTSSRAFFPATLLRWQRRSKPTTRVMRMSLRASAAREGTARDHAIAVTADAAHRITNRRRLHGVGSIAAFMAASYHALTITVRAWILPRMRSNGWRIIVMIALLAAFGP